MLLTANVRVTLIENSSSREAATAGLRAAALHIQQPSHLRHDGKVKVKVLYHVLFSRSLNQAAVAILVSLSQSSSTAQLCISEDTVCVCCSVLTYIPLTHEQSKLINSHPPPPALPHAMPLPSGGLAFVTRVIVTLSDSLSSTERGWTRAGQTSGRARLLLPGLSAWRPLLPSLLRAPGWLPPLAVLLPRRASHLSRCHAMQLVDRTYAGQGLRSTAWDFIIGANYPFDIYFRPHVRTKQFTANIY